MLENYQSVLTDVESKSVIDILRKRHKDRTINYLSKPKDIDKIKLTAINHWKEEIFNLFHSTITTTYTELLNHLLKTMNHILFLNPQTKHLVSTGLL